MEQQNLTPTPASEWKSAIKIDGEDVELPSGNVARCRRLSPHAFITSDILPDPLSAIVRKAIHTKQGLNPKDLEKITEDPDMLASAMQLFDTVLSFCVVEPRIQMPPACDVTVAGGYCEQYATEEVHKTPQKSGHHQYHEGPRDPNVLYADVVEMDDKMFIFQWALTGTSDLATFREELAASVESLQNGQDVPLPAL